MNCYCQAHTHTRTHHSYSPPNPSCNQYNIKKRLVYNTLINIFFSHFFKILFIKSIELATLFLLNYHSFLSMPDNYEE